jgi:hypothetical protein
MTLQLFGDDAPWDQMLDDQPILSGRHPLHLYHGFLGAQAFRHTGTSCCYDPAFQAGYPKTPVFDSGSRPAEFFLGVAGGDYLPAAYKVGLAICCMLVPVLLMIACRGAGLNRAATFLATAAGLLVWWGGQGRKALEAGDLDLYLTSLAVLAHAGLLLRFDRAPSVRCWFGLLVTGCLGWFGNPMLYVLLYPLFLVYYLSVGTKHCELPWHLALLATQAGAFGINAFWLTDWLSNWWIRSPLPHSLVTLPHRTLHTLWEAPVWGEQADRALAVLLLGSALVGLLMLNLLRRRAAARMFGLGAGGLWGLAVLGISWEPLGRVGTHGLMVPALWFATLPAAFAWTRAYRLLGRLTGAAWRGALVAGLALGAGAYAARETVAAVAERCTGTTPLVIGLGPERTAVVEAVTASTGPEARILWEEQAAEREVPHWTALLPLLTGRSFIGGLDPNPGIEHAIPGLTDQMLAGQPVGNWTDAALEGYCRRYNVGWIVCRSAAAVARFNAWSGAHLTGRLSADGPVYLFSVNRPSFSYVLKGQAELVHANWHHITLANVVPDDGRIVLSLHYQAGMRASPSRVQIEREQDPHYPIDFVRLRVASPVARVTLTWEHR